MGKKNKEKKVGDVKAAGGKEKPAAVAAMEVDKKEVKVAKKKFNLRATPPPMKPRKGSTYESDSDEDSDSSIDEALQSQVDDIIGALKPSGSEDGDDSVSSVNYDSEDGSSSEGIYESSEGSTSGEDDSQTSENSDSEDEGVDEEALDKVVKLLGDDGLDEEAQMQLGMLGEQDEDDEDDEDWVDDGEASASNSNEENSEDEDVEMGAEESSPEVTAKGDKHTAQKKTISSKVKETSKQAAGEDEDEDGIALDDLSDANLSLDADAVPQQKITINNEVRLQSQLSIYHD